MKNSSSRAVCLDSLAPGSSTEANSQEYSDSCEWGSFANFKVLTWGLPWWLSGEEPVSTGDMGSILDLGR